MQKHGVVVCLLGALVSWRSISIRDSILPIRRTGRREIWPAERNVAPGTDPREMPDGFDVLQCRVDPTALDTCPNAWGLNQNIYAFGPFLP